MPTNTIRTAGGSGDSSLTPTPATTAAASPRRHGRVLLVVCLSLATVVSAVASLNVALPEIARDTHATQTQLSWIVDAYALVFAALLLPAGALGDRYGRRRALIAGLGIFGAASLAAMLVSDANALIALRALLAVGAALVMPATLSTITATFPPERRPQAISVWAGVAGASAILGLLTSGIYLHNRSGLIAAVALIAVTASKAFLYDMGSLGGLYRVGSLVGLAVSLSLVALALQKFVLLAPKEQP